MDRRYPRCVNLLRRAPWYVVPLGIFLVLRLVDGFLIVMVAHQQIPASALPADMPMPTLVDPPSYLHVIANWDGQWYREIATHGYPAHLPTEDGVVQQNAWAFYPVYPALVRLLMIPGLSFGWAASVVSVIAGGAAVCLLYRMLESRCGRFAAALTVLALCCAPAAPILQAAYTDSLGLLLVLLALRLLDQGRFGWLAATGVVLALTRPITAPLAMVTAAYFGARWRHRAEDPFPDRDRRGLVLVTGALVTSAAIWPAVTGLVAGDWSAYGDTQRAWRGIAGNRPDTWLVSLAHGAPAVRWIVIFVFLAALVLIARNARQWSLGMRVWTVAYPVFILALTPPTSSLFRYLVLAGPAWWPAPGIGQRVRSPGARVGLALAVAVVGVALQFLWLRWYFVITPASRGTP
jgi:hypothetical protein